MHKIRSLVIIGIIALLSGNISASDPRPQEYLSRISIEISAEKTDYLPYEPIFIDYTIINHVNYLQHIPALMGMDEYFTITDKTGKTMPQCYTANYGIGDSLVPFQSYTGKADIRSPHCLTTPGKFICQLTFQGWSSNQLEFTIIEPEGDLREAWLLYNEAWSLRYNHDIESRRKSYTLSLQVIEKYPESIYAPKALQQAFFLYKYIDNQIVNDLQLVRDKSKESIKKSMRGIYLDQCLEAVVNTSIDLNDRAGAEEYLQSLIDENRSPELTDRATEWLEKLRNRPENE